MADAINRQVKVDVVMDVSNALRSVKGIQQALDKLSIKRIRENEVDDPFKPFTESAGKSSKALESFQKQLTQAKKQLENDLVKNNMSFTFINNKDFKDQTKKIEELTSKVRAFKELMNSLDQQKVLKNTTVGSGTVADSNAVAKFNTAELKRGAEEQKRIAEEREKQLTKERNQVEALKNAEKERTEQLKKQAELIKDSKGNPLGNVNTAGFKNYSTELAKTENYLAKVNYELNRTKEGTQRYRELKEELEKVRKEYAALNRESVNFRKQIGISNSRGFYDINHTLDYFRAKVRSRLVYSFATEAENLMMNIVPNYIDALSNYEQQRVNMAQVLPDDVAKNQKEMNDIMRSFIQIASDYGTSVDDVIEAGRLWGRIYKDVDMQLALTRASTKLSITDNMSLTEVNKGLEATLQQYRVHLKDATEAQEVSGKVIDTWAKLADNAGVTAANLAAASERAGGAAYEAGIGFNSLSAMIATMSQNTAKAGGEIGRSLRSMFISMTSAKSRKAMNELGVAWQEIGEDGVVRLRNMEEVIYDVMIALQKSKKDVREYINAFSGGKYQYNNVMALLSDPQKYKQYLEVARTSQGWADTQIDIQKDTISRQLQGLQSDLQALVVTLDDAGASSGLSNLIKDIRSIVQVLQNVDPNKISTLMDLMKYFAYFKGGQLAITGINNVLRAFLVYIGRTPNTIKTAIDGFDNMTLSATGAARAVGNVNKVFRLLGGIGSVIGIVLMAGEALYTFYQAYEKYSGKDESVITKFEDEASALPRLINEVAHYTEIVKQGSETEAEAAVNKQNLAEAEKELADKIGQAGVDRLKAAGFTKEAIETEIKYYKALRLEKDRVLKKSYETQLADTKATIEGTKSRIEIIRKEIEAQNELAQARLSAARTTYQMYIDRARGYHNAGNEQAANDLMNSWAAKAARADWEAAYDNLGEVINENKGRSELLSDLTEELAINVAKAAHYEQVLNPQSSVTDINPKEDPELNEGNKTDNSSKSNSGSKSSTQDYSEKARRNQLQREWNEIIYESNAAAKAYDSQLKQLNSDEQFYGETVASHNSKVNLYENRRKGLEAEQKALEKYQSTLETMLDNEMSANQQVAQAVGYKSDMTLDEKLKITEVNKELFQQIKSYSEIVNKINAANSKIEETKGKIIDINNEIRNATQLSQDPEKILEQNLKNINFEQAIASAKINRPTNIFQDRQQSQIEWEAEVKRSELYAQERLRLQQELMQAVFEGNDKAIQDTQNALNAMEQQYQESVQKIAELEYEKNSKIREGLADISQEFLIQGTSLRDIWNNLWTDLAREAIQRLFQVKAQSSFLGSLFGLFTGSSSGGLSFGAGTSAFDNAGSFSIGGIPLKTHIGGNIMAYPKMHSGGMVEQGRKGVVPQLRNDEVVRTLQVGEEVNSLADRRSNEILGAVAMKALDAENVRPNNVYIMAMDSRTFAEYLNDNADALLGVLAKQGALGRRK